MKTFLIHIFIFFFVSGIYPVNAQTGAKLSINKNKSPQKELQKNKGMVHCGRIFVDKNGDGYNDNAPDDDGDGIPNCLDPDYKILKMQKEKKACNTVRCSTEKETSRKNSSNPGLGNKRNK